MFGMLASEGWVLTPNMIIVTTCYTIIEMGSDLDSLHSGISFDVEKMWFNLGNSGFFYQECAFYSSGEYQSRTKNIKDFYK